MESTLCQFSDAQFKMSNFVVNQSHFKSIYDGILDLTKMVQGNDSYLGFLNASGEILDFFENFSENFFSKFLIFLLDDDLSRSKNQTLGRV